MHIPDAMLQGRICPVTAIISSISIAACLWVLVKKREKTIPSQFGAVAALIFAGQMMNFPILNGVSGHLIGGVLAARLLGLPLGILAMSLVIAIQSLLFSDGGVTVLGANILNMAILGTVVGDRIRVYLNMRWPGHWNWMATFVASWLSVMIAASAVSAELALSGWQNIFASMLGTHALIGLGEALITCAILFILSRYQKPIVLMTMSGLATLFISPFVCMDPDALEWIALKSGRFHEIAFHSIISSISISSFLGMLTTFCLAYLLVCSFKVLKINSSF